jgi:tRNA splicing ligase
VSVYSKILSADFYKLEITTGEEFAQTVAAIAAKGIKKETTLEVKDDFFTRLEETGSWGEEYLEGHILRLRMNSLPDKAGFNAYSQSDSPMTKVLARARRLPSRRNRMCSF